MAIVLYICDSMYVSDVGSCVHGRKFGQTLIFFKKKYFCLLIAAAFDVFYYKAFKVSHYSLRPLIAANEMHNETHFYCSSSERRECGKPGETLSQSPVGQ